MSVTEVDLDREGREAEVDDKFRVTYRRRWRVVSDTAADSEAIVAVQCQQVGPNPVPPIWAPHPQNGFAYFRGFKLTQQTRDDPKLWIAEGEFRPLEINREQNDNNQNPLARPTKYRLDGETYTEVVEKDKDGVPIVNAAKQPFDEPIEQENTRLHLVASKNFATLQEIIDHNFTFAGKVNSDTYRGAGAREWLCKHIQCSDIQNENGIEYYTGTFRLAYNPDGWRRSILNRGTKHYKAAGDLTLQVAEDTTGQPMNEPVLLAADGTRLPDNTAGNFLTFDVREEVAFSTLPI